MGLRGPAPMHAAERAARNGRDRRVVSIPQVALAAWGARAEQLEQLGLKLIAEASTAPVARTRSNGPQLSATLKAGLQLLDAADKIWSRLGRLGAAPTGPARPAAPREPAPSLDAYRERGRG